MRLDEIEPWPQLWSDCVKSAAVAACTPEYVLFVRMQRELDAERAARQEAERAATLRGVKAGIEAAWKVLAEDIHGRGIDRSVRHILALYAARIAEKAQPCRAAPAAVRREGGTVDAET